MDMGFLDRILGYALSRNISKRPSSESVPQPRNENADKILECGGFFASLLDKDKYIAKSEYLGVLNQYSSTIDFFTVLESSGMLADFCKKNKLSEAQVKSIISTYKEIEKRVDEHNEEYVSTTMNKEKQYLDKLLNDTH